MKASGKGSTAGKDKGRGTDARGIGKKQGTERIAQASRQATKPAGFRRDRKVREARSMTVERSTGG